MLSFFKSNNPGVVVFYWIYLLLFRICFFVSDHPYPFGFSPHEPLSGLVFGWFPTHTPALKIFSLSLSAILTFVQALLINGIVNNNKITTRKSYLPGLLFILYASFFPQTLICSPAQFALTFILLSVASIFRLSKNEKAYGQVFDVGFLAAVAALFYFPAVVFIVFAYIAMATIRSFSTREWTAVLLGFLAPIFLAFTWYFFTDTRPGNLLPDVTRQSLHLTQMEWLLMAAYTLTLLVWFFMLQRVLYSSLIQVRKFATLLIFLTFLIAVALLLQQHFSLSHLVLLSLPAAIIASMVITQVNRKVVVEVIHLILILLVLAGQYFPLLNIL